MPTVGLPINYVQHVSMRMKTLCKDHDLQIQLISNYFDDLKKNYQNLNKHNWIDYWLSLCTSLVSWPQASSLEAAPTLRYFFRCNLDWLVTEPIPGEGWIQSSV